MKIKRYISLVISLCLILTMILPAYAEEIVIGTNDNITGYLIPDESDQKERGGSYEEDFGGDTARVLIFSINAANVTQLLTSNVGNKQFQVESLPSQAKRIIVQANLSHSLQGVSGITGNLNETAIAGVCYYGYSPLYNDYVYISVASAHVPQGQFGHTFTFNFLIQNVLNSGISYYSYVKNSYGAGYVYGSVQLYYDIT